MTTNHHTPVPFRAALTSAVIEAPLSQLDAAIAAVVATGSGLSTTLTAQANAGQASLTVASSAGFAPGDSIFIGNGTASEARIVNTVPGGGVTITVTVNLTNTYAIGKAVSKSPVELLLARGSYATLVGRLADIEGRVYDAKRYGALGDGSTNDRTAIQAAVDAANAAGGGVVWLPPGNYVVTGPIDLKTGVTITGGGVGTTITANGNYAAITAANPTSRIAVTDLRIVGSANAANTLNRGIQFTGTTQGLIANVRTEGCFRGIALVTPSASVVIRDCYLTNDKSDNGAIDISGSEKSTVINCTVVTPASHGIVIREATASSFGYNRVVNCHVQAPGGTGIVVSGSSSTGVSSPGNEVIGCVVLSAGSVGIIAENGAQFTRIVGNMVRDSVGTGILVSDGTGDAPANNLVEGNTVRNAGDHGIHCFASNYNQVVGNRVSVFVNDGIRVSSGSVVGHDVISGNTVTDGTATTGAAIRVMTASDQAAVNGNTVSNTAGYGIRIEGSTGCAVNGNTVTDADNTGVLLIGGISVDGTAHRTMIVGNSSRRGSGTKQDYGVHITTGATNCMVVGNLLFQNTTGASLDNGTGTVLANNVTA